MVSWRDICACICQASEDNKIPQVLIQLDVDTFTASDQIYIRLSKVCRSVSGPGVGDYKANFLLSVIFRFFQYYHNTRYLLNITFIFDRCRGSSAVAAPVKYKCDSNNLRDSFGRSKILLTEKLTNGALVTPSPTLRDGVVTSTRFLHRRPLMINRNTPIACSGLRCFWNRYGSSVSKLNGLSKKRIYNDIRLWWISNIGPNAW